MNVMVTCTCMLVMVVEMKVKNKFENFKKILVSAFERFLDFIHRFTSSVIMGRFWNLQVR